MSSVADRYDAVVVDNDGVVTHPAARTELQVGPETAFRALGVEPTAEEVDALMGAASPRMIRQIATHHGITPARLWARHEAERATAQLTAVRAGRKQLYDGISGLNRLDTQTAIVSNTQQATIDGVVDAFGLHGFGSYIGRTPTLERYRRRKPNPSYLETMLDTLGTRSALYVGDSRVDVAAANAAGVDSADICRPHCQPGYLDGESTYRLDRLDGLLARPTTGDIA